MLTKIRPWLITIGGPGSEAKISDRQLEAHPDPKSLFSNYEVNEFPGGRIANDSDQSSRPRQVTTLGCGLYEHDAVRRADDMEAVEPMVPCRCDES